MRMMKCPRCGAENSVRRDHCYQCGAPLHSSEPQPAELDYVPTCANCAHAAVFPPPGKNLKPDEVWCMKQDAPVPAAQVAGDCFEEAFGWKREDILD